MKQDTHMKSHIGQDGILRLADREAYLSVIPKPDPAIYKSEWYLQRPPEVQALIKMFSMSTRLTIQDIVYYVAGIGETVSSVAKHE